jgi:hypothetical protein
LRSQKIAPPTATAPTTGAEKIVKAPAAIPPFFVSHDALYTYMLKVGCENNVMVVIFAQAMCNLRQYCYLDAIRISISSHSASALRRVQRVGLDDILEVLRASSRHYRRSH